MSSRWSPERKQFLQGLVRRKHKRAVGNGRLHTLDWPTISNEFNAYFGTQFSPTYLYRRTIRDRQRAQAVAVEYVAGIEWPKLEPVTKPELIEVQVKGENYLAQFKIVNTHKNVTQVVVLALARLNVVGRQDQQLLKDMRRQAQTKEAVDGNEGRPDEDGSQEPDQG